MSNSSSYRSCNFGYRAADLHDGTAAHANLESRYRPVGIPAVVAALEAMRRAPAKPAPEAVARIWAGREFD